MQSDLKPVDITSGLASSREAGMAFSRGGRTNRAATNRHRDRRAHHVEQHANATGGIKALKPSHDISKWSREDSH
jgi:hypothetical protein